MVTLLRIVLSLPISTSICERGFSAQNVIKTIRRTRLNDNKLEALLRIATNGPPPELMDHTAAVNAWLRVSKRTEDPAQKQKSTLADQGAELSEDQYAVPIDMNAKRALLFGQ